MSLKRIGANISVLLIPVLVVLFYGRISMKIALFFRITFSFHISSFLVQMLIVGIAAVLVVLLVIRFGLKRRILVWIVLIFTSVLLVNMRHEFYENHDHPNESQMIYLAECEQETKYDTFWEYLTQGCHVTLKELIVVLCYKNATWIGVFFLTDFIIRGVRRSKNKKKKSQLIDEI